MKLQFSELLFFSALYWSIVIGTTTVNSGLDGSKSITTKKLEISSHSLKKNESTAASGNDSDLTIILSDNNNTSQTNFQTDIKKNIELPEKKASNNNKNLSVSQHENKTDKFSLISLIPTTAPELGKWIIKDNSTNKTCIIAQMIMQLNITYPSSDNKGANATINGPGKNSTAHGSCLDLPESINITWGDSNHVLKINFEKNATANDFYISGISVEVNTTILPNFKDNATFFNYSNKFGELFETPLGMSYKCGKMQTLNLSSLSNPKFNAVLTLKDTQFQAYMNNTKSEFGIAQDCETFDTPDIVPIAVGTALAVLVVVVLIAYLVGRRRSQNRGYLSM